MITTSVNICNRALRKVGAIKITDLSSTTDQNAIIMNDLYDDSLRVVLCEANWMFATKRAELSLTADDTSVIWTKNNLVYAYNVPSDFLRLVGWSESHEWVRQEGDYFLSNSDGGITKVSVNENTTATPAWKTATAYVLGDYILNDDYVYYCKASHSSSESDEPGTGTSYATYWTVMREESTGVWTLSIDKKLGLIYVYYNTTIAEYPPYFLEAFVDKLALDASYMLSQSSRKTEYLETRYEATLSDAKSKNSQGQSPASARADAWLNARHSGANSWDNVGINYR